jgi:ankyrin repeat protein
LGENINSRETQTFKTLIHIACRKGNLELLKFLCDLGADLESIDFEYMTPLFEAVICKNKDIVKFLVEEKKVNIEHKEIQDRTAFYWVACNGDIDMIKYLIDKNAEPNGVSRMGRTPLSKACWNGKIEVVEILVKLPQIKINEGDKNGRYPLHNAVWGSSGGRMGKKIVGENGNDSPSCAKVKD